MDLPAPLTPPDSDLRGLAFMPVDLVRLFDSDLYALSTGDEFKAAFTLWGRSFLQVPAASLPDDDRVLAHLSGSGSRWKKVKKMALHGWVKCADGRLYHPVVAAKAQEAWQRRLEQRDRAKKRWAKDGGDNPPGSGAANATAHATASPVAHPNAPPAAYAAAHPVAMQGTGTGTGTGTKPSNQPLGSASAPELPLERLILAMKLDHKTLHRRPSFREFPALFREWKAAGCDPERDIWPTIERLAARKPDIASPKFFEAAILRARDDRIAAEPTERERWATRVEGFKASGFWPEAPPPEGYGPKPGQPGCLCPADLLIGAAA